MAAEITGVNIFSLCDRGDFVKEVVGLGDEEFFDGVLTSITES